MQSQTDPENVNAEIFKAGLSSGKKNMPARAKARSFRAASSHCQHKFQPKRARLAIYPFMSWQRRHRRVELRRRWGIGVLIEHEEITMPDMNRNSNLNRDNNSNRTTMGIGNGTIWAILGALVIVGALFVWPTLRGFTGNTANNSSSTVGQTSNRPVAPAAPMTTRTSPTVPATTR